VASILAGIVGGWLAGHWVWGIACAFLVLLGVAAIATNMGVRDENTPDDRSISIAMGHHSTVSDSVIANGNVDQSRTTRISAGAGAIVAIVALCGATGGTWYYARQPAGHRPGGPVTGTQIDTAPTGATLTAQGVSVAFHFGPPKLSLSNAQTMHITGFDATSHRCRSLQTTSPSFLGEMLIRVTTPAAVPVKFTILFQSYLNVVFNYRGRNVCPAGPDELTVSASMSHPAVFVAWWRDPNAFHRVRWPGVPLTNAEKMRLYKHADLGQDIFHLGISPPNDSDGFGAGNLSGPRVTSCARQYGVVIVPAGTVSPNDC
jgi:hypothetical protein